MGLAMRDELQNIDLQPVEKKKYKKVESGELGSVILWSRGRFGIGGNIILPRSSRRERVKGVAEER